ncbi:MAG: hypothetical protein HY897_17070 [Deltaproteobacteria bacterium]|nr:hypothetical protein [Deltaproteobacteria bacterium]
MKVGFDCAAGGVVRCGIVKRETGKDGGVLNRRGVVVWTALLLAAPGFCACDSSGGFNVRLSFGQAKKAASSCAKFQANKAGSTPCGISKFRLCAANAAAGAVIYGDYGAAEGEPGVTLEVPPGDYALSFQGYDAEREDLVVWCGRALGLSVKADETTQVSMFVARCSDFVFTAGAMKTKRAFHAAAPLPDGRVLLTGGVGELDSGESCGNACTVVSAQNAAEIYDPATGEFEAAGAMSAPRAFHTATTLADGTVVIAGGAETVRVYRFPGGGTPMFVPDTLVDSSKAAEAFDPESKKFKSVSGAGERAMHAAVATRGGKVVLVGGVTEEGAFAPSDSIEVGDAKGFSAETQMSTPRAFAAAADFSAPGDAASTVLIWGGNVPGAGEGNAGIFGEVWSEGGGAGSTRTPAALEDDVVGLPLFHHAAALLPDQRVIVAGGMFVKDYIDKDGSLFGPAEPLRKVRLVDLAGTNGVTVPEEAAYELRYARAMHTATPLPDGRVLVTGGFSARTPSCKAPVCFDPTDTVEVFIPISEIFDTLHPAGLTGAGNPLIVMGKARAGHTATPLPDGSVLVAGGASSGKDVEGTAEVFSPLPTALGQY